MILSKIYPSGGLCKCPDVFFAAAKCSILFRTKNRFSPVSRAGRIGFRLRGRGFRRKVFYPVEIGSGRFIFSNSSEIIHQQESPMVTCDTLVIGAGCWSAGVALSGRGSTVIVDRGAIVGAEYFDTFAPTSNWKSELRSAEAREL